MARRPEALAPKSKTITADEAHAMVDDINGDGPTQWGPEGSAERVLADEVVTTMIAAEDLPDDYRTDEPAGAFATGYANGEAVDVPVEPPSEGQAELFPDMPKALSLWPEFDGKRVTKVKLAFAGECDLLDGASDRELAAQTGRLDNEVTVTIRGIVGGRNFRNVSKSPREAHGVCTITVQDVRLADGAEYDELEEAREEAAGYNETIIDWVTAARLVAEQFELADDELGELVRGIAAYRLPGEVVVEADGSDPATSSDVEESEQPSMLDAALAEAMA